MATLLLADDSVTIQRVIELTFADEDIEVIAVSNGDEAIARMEASPPLDEALHAPPAAPVPPTPADIGDYFDRLDAAFSNLAAAPAMGGRSAAPAAIAADIDWIGRSPEEPADLPLTYGSSPTMKHTP